MFFTISEAAARVGLTTYTLRYYDKEGLLPMVERSSGGIRMFKESDFEWIELIECLKASGLTIHEIKQYIDWYTEGNSTLKQRRQLFYARKAALENQMEELQKTLNTIRYKCWFYDTALSAGDESIPQNMAPEAMPPEIRKLREDCRLSFGRAQKQENPTQKR